MDALLADADRIIQEARTVSDAATAKMATRAAARFVTSSSRRSASDRRVVSRGGRRQADPDESVARR